MGMDWKNLRRLLFAAGSFILISFINGLVGAAEVTARRLIEAEKEPNNWLTYSGTYNAWRYSPLDQINKTTIRKLVPVWAF